MTSTKQPLSALAPSARYSAVSSSIPSQPVDVTVHTPSQTIRGTLSPKSITTNPTVSPKVVIHSSSKSINGLWNLLLWMIIITAITWIVLLLLNPTFIQKRNLDGTPSGEVDQSKLVVISIVIGVAIVIIWYFIKKLISSY